jgi:hypothetical protein
MNHETEEERKARQRRGYFARLNNSTPDVWRPAADGIEKGDRLQRRKTPSHRWWQEWGVLETPADAERARELIRQARGYYRVVRGWYSDRLAPRVIAK